MTVLIWLAGALASAIIALLLTLLFQDNISVFLAKTSRGFWSAAGNRSVTGRWYTYYATIPEEATSPTAAVPSGSVEVIRLRQIGNRVAGANEQKSRDYVIIGVLRNDSYLTGTWRDFSERRYHWGGFQLWWLDSGSGMVGKFIGKDSRNHINHGMWLWARSENGLYELADWAATRGGYGFDVVMFKCGLDAAIQRKLDAPDGSNSEA